MIRFCELERLGKPRVIHGGRAGAEIAACRQRRGLCVNPREFIMLTKHRLAIFEKELESARARADSRVRRGRRRTQNQHDRARGVRPRSGRTRAYRYGQHDLSTRSVDRAGRCRRRRLQRRSSSSRRVELRNPEGLDRGARQDRIPKAHGRHRGTQEARGARCAE